VLNGLFISMGWFRSPIWTYRLRSNSAIRQFTYDFLHTGNIYLLPENRRCKANSYARNGAWLSLVMVLGDDLTTNKPNYDKFWWPWRLCSWSRGRCVSVSRCRSAPCSARRGEFTRYSLTFSSTKR